MKFDGMSAENENIFKGYIGRVNAELERYFAQMSENAAEQRNVAEAMRYSVSAGGKRIRPVLAMEFCRVCGGNADDALPAACAIEMIHTFSLIHDDLPCMDDDDMRRGKPSCHKAYGEATALLAGDALENEAFLVIADDKKLSDAQKVRLVRILSEAVGVFGMTGGQVIDTENDGKTLDEALLLKMYGMKTGALLRAACQMGCVCAGADDEKIRAAGEYALALGLAFQIIDDILDITSTTEQLGKTAGSDRENGKNTYASINGAEKSEAYAAELTENALSALGSFENSDFLREFTLYLLNRKN